ncbi:MAG: hypothetical protein ACI4U3_02405 [Traorella sp.]
MNKLKKRVLSLLLAISVFIFPLSNVKASTKVIVTPIIASVTIYSTINNDHSWLVIKNVSGSTIQVGKMTVINGDSVSIGTFGNISQHKGIWYNIELALSVSTYVSITRTIESTSILNTLNNKINSKDSWSITNTCSKFAATVWNSVFDDKVSTGILPSGLANSIKNYNYSTNAAMPLKSTSSIYYHTSTGVVNCPEPNFSGSSSLSRTTNNGLTSFTIDQLNILNECE